MLKFQVVLDKLTPSIKKINDELKNLPKEAYDVWRDNTPVKSGNARRKTTLGGNQIRADYPYAVPLDKGRSKQAPQGMLKPTDTFIKNRVKKILGA